jgi:hypothetical protein
MHTNKRNVKVLKIKEATKLSTIIAGINLNSNQLPLKHTASLQCAILVHLKILMIIKR